MQLPIDVLVVSFFDIDINHHYHTQGAQRDLCSK